MRTLSSITRRSLIIGAPALLLGATKNYKTKSILQMREEFIDTNDTVYNFQNVMANRKINMGAIIPWRYDSILISPKPSDIIARDFLLCPEWAFNWDQNQQSATEFFDGWLQPLFDFCKSNKKMFRGHTIYYYQNLPHAIKDICLDKSNSNKAVEDVLYQWVFNRVSKYREIVSYWVINENFARNWQWHRDPFFDRFGDRFIDIIFQAARAADKKAIFEINGYGLEYSGYQTLLSSLIKLLEKLKARGVTIQRVGCQCHFSQMQSEIAALDPYPFEVLRQHGVELNISEIDVDDRDFKGSVEDRDLLVASTYYSFLSMITKFDNLVEVTSWSAFDVFNWIMRGVKDIGHGGRPDPNSRPGWFDKDFNAKLSYFATAKALLGS